MTNLSLMRPEVVDGKRRRAAVESLRAARVTLPRWSELADPARISSAVMSDLKSVGPDEPDERNLWRVHWFNDASRTERVFVPGHVVLPQVLTGVKAPIVVLLGRRFPMIGAHKVLAAYACLVPRLVTGQFDPRHDRAVWPSTGNYCRGGVAISRILGCRGVAVLPAGMSRERFEWLQEWVSDPADIIRTPGTESNVKEIYDKCAELARDKSNVILNQFSEFANYLIHYFCTGAALDRVFAHVKGRDPARRLAAFVCATGSAGTIAAGDYLKARHGTKIAAVEAIECPTMLCNGYGEHNIQGIGDKHIPLIHNVMNTDVVIGVSDLASDSLNALFGGNVGRSYLAGRRKIDPDVMQGIRRHRHLGTGEHHCRHQARQASRSRRRRRDHDRRDRQRTALRQRAAELSGPALSTDSMKSMPARSSAGISKASSTITCSSSPISIANAFSISVISPGWSSKA